MLERQVDDANRIQLQGDVQIDVGGYAFTAAEAIAGSIVCPPPTDWSTSWRCSSRVEEPTRRAGLGVTGEDVLIVGSARARSSSRPRSSSAAEISTLLRRGKRLARYLEACLRRRLPEHDASGP